jgi:hypothetical protein
MFAVVASTPNGTEMVASVHDTESEADAACQNKRNSGQGRHWHFSVEIVIDDAIPHPAVA